MHVLNLKRSPATWWKIYNTLDRVRVPAVTALAVSPSPLQYDEVPRVQSPFVLGLRLRLGSVSLMFFGIVQRGRASGPDTSSTNATQDRVPVILQ
ncbi:hypothetical protein FDECE_14820 [Fusarium decemcellulare]|nr:hypothetical protein FDECE_14820 [Fusarium decemcellulare]